ncbi:hypothetical protein BOQ64_21075 [Chryseobacterium sp. CH25]|nr:hypothetical protein BOQ64_21075 [Chryseobacterium sp. CH25]RXM62933.1 hypothetical protein BOQ60_18835 [Chryseobacterium sp. CH1]
MILIYGSKIETSLNGNNLISTKHNIYPTKDLKSLQRTPFYYTKIKEKIEKEITVKSVMYK